LELQHEWEKIRGTDETSCLTRLFGHDSLQRSNCSATFQLEEALKSLQSNILMHHIPQSWLFIHGYRDPIVPYKHSSDFFDLLEQTGILNVSLKSYDNKNTGFITFLQLRKILDNIKINLKDELIEYLIFLMKSFKHEKNTSLEDLKYAVIS